MGNKIIVCGGNGAGKSTLGRQLAQELGWKFMDIEDYYFPEKSSDYNYAVARTREEVAKLLKEDMKKYDNFVLASVKGNYGEAVTSMFTCAVFICVPKEIRMKRVKERSYQKFGDRMLQGGDLYEQEQSFFDMVERRSEKDVTDWLQSMNIPVIRVDGTQSIDSNVKTIKLYKKMQQIFAGTPEVIYGYTDISYSSFSEEFQSALVFAVPYEEQLTLDNYTEEGFEKSILNARDKLEIILKDIEGVLQEEGIKYYIPPVAQKNEEELLAVFSFKYAAVNAGLGWIGKNDVLVTEKYGPRVRLSVVLVDYPFQSGNKITESRCDTCNKCVDICPYSALKGINWDINSLRNDIIDYHLCNQKRSAYIEKHGRKNACGLCMVVCPFGVENNM